MICETNKFFIGVNPFKVEVKLTIQKNTQSLLSKSENVRPHTA